jgi:muramidase (phage lysozyme)
MTLNVALLIAGRNEGAKAALADTQSDLRKLGAVAAQTGDAAGQAAVRAGQGAARAAQLTAQQLGQMQFQLQDMAVGLASGQSPFTVMTQQGSQIAQMFGGGTGVMGALRAVGQGLKSFLLNPLNLTVVGAGLAASAVTGIASAVMQNFPSVNDLIEAHNDLVSKIGENWDESARRAKRYSAETRETLLLSAVAQTSALKKAYEQELAGLNRLQVPQAAMGEGLAGMSLGERIRASGDEGLIRLTERFSIDLEQGWADIAKFRSAISAVGAASNDDSVRALAQDIVAATQSAAELQADYRQNQDLVKGLKGDHDALNQALGKGSEAVRGFTSSLSGLSHMGPRGPVPDSALPSAKLSLLDLIGYAEGTDRGRGYNETLGYGKFTGGPVDLVTMTVNQVMALQSKMLADPANTFNSSAVGRYQITRQTLADFMPRLGLTGDTVFSPEVQDRIALAIANAAGRDVQKLTGRWESFKFLGQGTILNAFDGASGQRAAVANSIETRGVKEETQSAEASRRWAEALNEATQAQRTLAASTGRSAAEMARQRTEERLWAEARRAYGDQLEKDEGLNRRVAASIRAQGQAVEELTRQEQARRLESEAARQAAQAEVETVAGLREAAGGFLSAFRGAFQNSRNFTDGLLAGLQSVENKLLDLAQNALLNALFGGEGTAGAGFLGSLLGGGAGSGGIYAQGAAFAGGAVIPFATGGVVSAPTLFPMAGGRRGLMGEAGEEAIMPLARTPSGALGVRSAGGGGRGLTIHQTTINNSKAEAATTVRQDEDGHLSIDTVIEDKVIATMTSRRGGRAMGDAYGIRRRPGNI